MRFLPSCVPPSLFSKGTQKEKKKKVTGTSSGAFQLAYSDHPFQ